MQTNESPFTLTKAEAENLALAVVNGARLTFSNQANRNWVAKICRTKYRLGTYDLVKSSIRNQSVDPRYIVETSHLPDRGLANTRSFYGSLYKLERSRRW